MKRDGEEASRQAHNLEIEGSNPSPATTKTCVGCREPKPTTEFYFLKRNGKGRDNYVSRCKDCYRARQRERRAERLRGLTPEQIDARRAKSRAYNRKNRKK